MINQSLSQEEKVNPFSLHNHTHQRMYQVKNKILHLIAEKYYSPLVENKVAQSNQVISARRRFLNFVFNSSKKMGGKR